MWSRILLLPQCLIWAYISVLKAGHWWRSKFKFLLYILNLSLWIYLWILQQRVVVFVVPLIEKLESRILAPTPYSPLQWSTHALLSLPAKWSFIYHVLYYVISTQSIECVATISLVYGFCFIFAFTLCWEASVLFCCSVTLKWWLHFELSFRVGSIELRKYTIQLRIWKLRSWLIK